jgi:hypothetical protein
VSALGTLWRIRTRRHIRTMRSILSSAGPDRFRWPRVRETERLGREIKRWQARRQLHERQQSCTVRRAP